MPDGNDIKGARGKDAYPNVPELKPGQPVPIGTISALTEIARKQTSGATAPKQVLRGTGKEVGAQDQWFKIVEEKDDYLVCNRWDWNTAGTAKVNVAKNYLNRKTPFDSVSRNGITYAYSTSVIGERTATDDETSSTEDQVVIPRYVVGDVIKASSNFPGGTGVTDEQGIAVIWSDRNEDGRAWAQKIG